MVGEHLIVVNLHQSLTELHPGEGHTGLHHMVGGLRLALLAAIPALECRTRASDVDFGVNDVLHGLLHRLEQYLLARNLVEFQQTYVARHHLVGLLPILGREPLLGEWETGRNIHTLKGFADEFRPIGLREAAGNVGGEIEILLAIGSVVEVHHRLQHRAARHTVVVAR